ncbi:MAG: aldolase catalytic domain-containing protein [Lachnospiraceae bacterium]|nr:aldolase catalytic domain-containing protein [Lachnospiraceae bacterium]
MSDNMEPILLDCTLRDGGYVNNWEFNTDTAKAVMEGLYNSGVRCIEIGIMGMDAKAGTQTKFNNFQEMEPLLGYRRKDCSYAVMTTTKNADSFELPYRSEKTPDIIRLAYFQKDWKEALESIKVYQEKGYSVFLQAMATFMYSMGEMDEMIRAVNVLKPSAFYMVDSFSTMYPGDVRRMRDNVLKCLSHDIAFGFHAHNNIQMAFANVMEFLDIEPCDRQLFVDSSIFGMGRGAGNVPTELLMEYLNHQGCQFNTAPILSVYQKYLEPIYHQYGWGYSLPYYLTAVHKTNSAYGWYYLNHGVDKLTKLDAALGMVPEQIRYTLKKDVAERIIKEVVGLE